MTEKNIDFYYCNNMIKKFEKVIENPVCGKSSIYYTGVDLGTACIVIAVFDENKNPVAGAYRYANVVKDGMIIDYIGALKIVKELKEEIESKIGVELIKASGAIPPGTDLLDSGAVRNVIQGAGFECVSLLDESTAANEAVRMKNGAMVDIGGGTTGISVFKDGRVVYVADEPTGGTHFSLVIAGAYKKSFETAEAFKREEQNHMELMPVVKPVVDKVSSIIISHIKDYDVDCICLVGGTCCFTGIEKIIEKQTGIPTYKPVNPMFVTPLGIALSCC